MRGCEDGSAPRCWGSFHCWLFSGLIDWNVKSVDKNNNEAETCDIMFRRCCSSHTVTVRSHSRVNRLWFSLFISVRSAGDENKLKWSHLIWRKSQNTPPCPCDVRRRRAADIYTWLTFTRQQPAYLITAGESTWEILLSLHLPNVSRL